MHRHPGYHRRQLQQANKQASVKPLPGYHRRRAWALDIATYATPGKTHDAYGRAFTDGLIQEHDSDEQRQEHQRLCANMLAHVRSAQSCHQQDSQGDSDPHNPLGNS